MNSKIEFAQVYNIKEMVYNSGENNLVKPRITEFWFAGWVEIKHNICQSVLDSTSQFTTTTQPFTFNLKNCFFNVYNVI